MKAKLSSLTRRLEEFEMRNQHEVRAVVETPVHLQPCFNCQLISGNAVCEMCAKMRKCTRSLK